MQTAVVFAEKPPLSGWNVDMVGLWRVVNRSNWTSSYAEKTRDPGESQVSPCALGHKFPNAMVEACPDLRQGRLDLPWALLGTPKRQPALLPVNLKRKRFNTVMRLVDFPVVSPLPP